jgi:hypothetical protein
MALLAGRGLLRCEGGKPARKSIFHGAHWAGAGMIGGAGAG